MASTLPLVGTPSGMPIRRLISTLMTAVAAVVLLTCAGFVTQDVLTYRQATVRNLTTLGEIIATNSTAALAFQNPDDATDVLGALRAERHISAAALYDAQGELFAKYPADLADSDLPARPGAPGFHYEGGRLGGFQSVVHNGGPPLGTLYVQSDMKALQERLWFSAGLALCVLAASLLITWLISRQLHSLVGRPILSLAETAHALSERRDYSVRVVSQPVLELNQLTTAFNSMLQQLQERDRQDRELQGALQSQLTRLQLLNRITRAIGERLDLSSIFQVVIRSLEDSLPVDAAFIALHDRGGETLQIASIGTRSEDLKNGLDYGEGSRLELDGEGLSRCAHGELVYKSDTSRVSSRFGQHLAAGGYRSVVLAPLLAESNVFGVLVALRRATDGFTVSEREFLGQLSEHVALAAHQAQLYTALQTAYDDLRQSQQTVLQQERLRALGEMASGIAHDINNALSPVSLYTESLLDREQNLSERARDYLQTIQRAVDDVSQTVQRMREFYRPREPQLMLSSVEINKIVQQIVDLTRARWRDQPQQQGIVISLETVLAPDLPRIMGAESEIRDALTNLVFNSVDAMPKGGTLRLVTKLVETSGTVPGEVLQHVAVEVSDTGIGMSEETRRRCLEPFYTTKGERGTGLGLAMVFGMVQRHSADLEIESVEGQGTTVRLVFPVPVDTFMATQHVPVSTEPAKRLRILVVDDDPLLIKSLRDTLESDGHGVVSADGGQAGIDAFQASLKTGRPFDAVITDLGMPYVDGRKVTAAIRALSAGVPIILLTGWGNRLLAENDVPDGVDRVLSKPPRLHELRAALTDLTTRMRAGAAGS